MTRTETVVLWARHGENQANLTRTLSHRVVDRELTDRGRGEARALTDSLATARLHPQVYSSPLRRARETTAIVAERCDLRPVVIDEFRELDVGEMDGRSDPTAWQTYDRVLSPGGRASPRRGSRVVRASSSWSSGSGAASIAWPGPTAPILGW